MERFTKSLLSIKHRWKEESKKLNFLHLLIGTFVVALLPLVLVTLSYQSKLARLKRIEKALVSLEVKAARAKVAQKGQLKFWQEHGKAPKHYLEKKLEGMFLLKTERDVLNQIVTHSAFSECKGIEKRLKRLETENALHFAEIKRDSTKQIEEIFYEQQGVVEMDMSDLLRFLYLVETKKGRPQLIFKRFSLKRNPLSTGRENYLVSVELIKREKKR